MARIRLPKKPEDFVSDKWTGKPQMFRAFQNIMCESNGAIPRCAGRDCEFFRRGECWIDSVERHCVWPYFWRRVDEEGNVLDRDGFIWIKAQKILDKMEQKCPQEDMPESIAKVVEEHFWEML